MKGLDTMVNTNYALQKKKKGKKQIMQFFVEFIKCIKKGLLQKKLIIGFLTRWNVIRNVIRMKHTLIIKRAISFLQQPHNKWFDKNGILANLLAINPLVSNDPCFFRHAGFPKTTRNTSAATKRWEFVIVQLMKSLKNQRKNLSSPSFPS